jgi:L-alanine-DL-glutamate epimerase-like enolase superfamily enzyme
LNDVTRRRCGEVPWRSELVDPPERVEGGGLVLPERPGLGYVMNGKLAAKYAVSALRLPVALSSALLVP